MAPPMPQALTVASMIMSRMTFERRCRSALTPALLVAVVACDRGHRDAPAPLKVPAPSQTAEGSQAARPTAPAGRTCTLAAIPTKVPLSPALIVAIGDLHGDLA